MGAGSMARWVQIMKAETFILDFFYKICVFKKVSGLIIGGCMINGQVGADYEGGNFYFHFFYKIYVF